jgi:hypothetical protein
MWTFFDSFGHLWTKKCAQMCAHLCNYYVSQSYQYHNGDRTSESNYSTVANNYNTAI